MKYLLLTIYFFSSTIVIGQSSVVGGEWFLDMDPGFGNGMPFSGITPADEITASAELTAAETGLGLHVFGVRVKDAKGRWSHTATRAFKVLAAPGREAVVGFEWFIDNDPSIGNGQRIEADLAGDRVTASTTFPAGAVTLGSHTFSARTQNSAGRWSHTVARQFKVFPLKLRSELTELEWFWDEDPGYGAANSRPLTGDTASANFIADVNDLTPGIHNLNVRVKNENSVWSQTHTRNTLLRGFPEAPIASFQYSYLNDNADTLATFTFPLSEPRHLVDITFDPNTDDLVDRQIYAFCIRAIRTDGITSFDKCRRFEYRMPTTATDNTLATTPLLVYPNPNQGNFNLQLPEAAFGDGHLRIFDATGRQALQRTIAVLPGQSLPLSLPNAQSGMHFVVVELANSVFVGRVTIK